MKKIKHSINQKDRIVCVALPKEIRFYYQFFDTGERIALNTSKDDRKKPFTGSIFNFFRKKGRYFDGHSGFSLTLKELYSTKRCYYRNPKLAKLFDRLSDAIDLALRERDEKQSLSKDYYTVNNKYVVICKDRELAA